MAVIELHLWGQDLRLEVAAMQALMVLFSTPVFLEGLSPLITYSLKCHIFLVANDN